MPFTDLTTLLAAVDKPQRIKVLKTAASGISQVSMWYSTWRNAPTIGTLPSIGAGDACDINTVGAVPFLIAGAGKELRIVAIQVDSPATADQSGGICIADRLVHTSGLSALITGGVEQTVNSVALPARAGNGVGVELFIEGYATMTYPSVPNITARYTNSDGVTNRVTQSVPWGGVTARVGQFRRLPLQAGDVGVRSVQGVTFDVTGSVAGNAGVTLLNRVTMLQHVQNAPSRHGGLNMGIPLINNDACLFFFSMTNAGGDFPATAFDLTFAYANV